MLCPYQLGSAPRIVLAQLLAVVLRHHPSCGVHIDCQNTGNGGVVCLSGSCVYFNRKMQTKGLALQLATEFQNLCFVRKLHGTDMSAGAYQRRVVDIESMAPLLESSMHTWTTRPGEFVSHLHRYTDI